MSNTLLRPNQIAEYERTRESLEKKLGNKYIQDKGAVRAQLKRLEKNLESQRPQEIKSPEKDKVVKETKNLLQEILVGMPSHEEMRKCPPGAIDKHRMWEKRNKEKIRRWKNNQLRLHVGSDQVDIANIEVHRPTRSSLNMDNAFIPGSEYNLPENVGYCIPFKDEEIKLIRKRAPADIWMKLPTMTAEQRSIVRQMFITTWEDPAIEPLEVEISDYKSEESTPVETLEVEEKEKEEIKTFEEPPMEATNSLSDISSLWQDEEPKEPTNANRNKRRHNR